MATDWSIIQGAYLRDILDQPSALSTTLANLKRSADLRKIASKLREGKFRNVVLTGMGSSYYALHPINIELIAKGFSALMVETSELIHYQQRLLDPNSLVIAVSQSGQSAEILRLIEMNRSKAPLVAVTNTADSPLARSADAVLLTEAGTEFSVSCKTYVAALMALRWLVEALLGSDLARSCDELAQATPSAESYLKCWKLHVVGFVARLRGIRQLFMLGRGPSLAAAGTGGLIVKESDHFPAEGMSCAAFRHGPFEMLSHESFVLIFDGDSTTKDLNAGLIEDLRKQGGNAELVGENASFDPCKIPGAPASVRPILEILPVEMITLALAAQMGREPGRFERATKVTSKE